MANVLRQNLRSELDRKQSAIFAFAEKLTQFPEAVTTDDIAGLQNEGLREAAISEGIVVVAVFSLITRMADALRFKIPNDVTAGADLLRRFGYRAMATPWNLFLADPWRSKTPADEETMDLPDSMMRWLESVTPLGTVARASAPAAARAVVSAVLSNPTTVSDHDVVTLKNRGCTEKDIFDLILSAAATASLLRLKAAHGALRHPPQPPTVNRSMNVLTPHPLQSALVRA